MKIFCGSTSKELTSDIIRYLNNELDQTIILGDLKIDYFSDGEILPMFNESIRDKDIFFVQSTISSNSIMETLLVIDASKRAGCKSFTLVAPFQGYSRQDKTDHLRSSIGSKMLADILEKVGMSKIITIDLHASSIQGFFNIPVIHLNGNKIFIEYILENKIEDLTILAPDQGAVKKTYDFMKAFPDATFAMINKRRVKPNEIHSMELVGDVRGRNVVIIDDMIDTGGTLLKATDLIINSGANTVRAIATHGIFSGAGFENIEKSKLLEVLVSDTIPVNNIDKIPSKIKYVSCAKFLSKVILSIRNNGSINDVNGSLHN